MGFSLIGIASISTSCSPSTQQDTYVDVTFDLNDIENWDTTSKNAYCNMFPQRNYTIPPYANTMDDPIMLKDLNKYFSTYNFINTLCCMYHNQLIADESDDHIYFFYYLRLMIDFHNGKFFKFTTERIFYWASTDSTSTELFKLEMVKLKPGMQAEITSAHDNVLIFDTPNLTPGGEHPFASTVWFNDHIDNEPDVNYSHHLDDAPDFTNVIFP